jgi:cytochrome c
MVGYKPNCFLKPLFILLIPLIEGCGENGSGVDTKNSRQVYRMCVSCHSMVPGRHLTGPSLSGIWGRKAGTAEGFTRYSDALKSSEVVWTAESMDA